MSRVSNFASSNRVKKKNINYSIFVYPFDYRNSSGVLCSSISCPRAFFFEHSYSLLQKTSLVSYIRLYIYLKDIDKIIFLISTILVRSKGRSTVLRRPSHDKHSNIPQHQLLL